MKFSLTAICLSFLLICQSVLASDSTAPYILTFPEQNLAIRFQFLATPQAGKDSQAVLETLDLNSGELTSTQHRILVRLWMPSMNHGSAPTQINRWVDQSGAVLNTTYLVKNVFFTMGGSWEVQVLLNPKTASEVMQSFRLDIPGGHGGGHIHH